MSKQEVCTVSRKIIIDDFSLSKVYSQQLSLTPLQPWMLQNCWFLKSGLGHRRKNEKKKKNISVKAKKLGERGLRVEGQEKQISYLLFINHVSLFNNVDKRR